MKAGRNGSTVQRAPRRAVALADVAAKAGVDASTASRILNHDAGYRVSAATRERVLATAAELGYSPNPMARGLRTARTRSIGIVVPQIENPLYAEIIAGAARAVRAHDYTLLVAYQEDWAGGGSVYEKVAQVNRVDGLIAAPLDAGPELMAAFERIDVPYVVVHRRIRGIERCIIMDSYAAAKLAVHHLIEQGHRRIAYVARRSVYYNDTRRLAGYKAALREAGIGIDERLIIHSAHTREGGINGVEALLQSGVVATAIFTVTPFAASGIMAILAEKGLRVPGDVSVLALYDHGFAEALQPPVTTVGMPLQDMGAAAVDVLIAMLQGRAPPPVRPLLPRELNLRKSTGPVPLRAGGAEPGAGWPVKRTRIAAR
ncbi:LacI family DNA-binding transcriptional regulator [Chelatococcus sp. GCM10030263]|uniref:LacI family DNA-binding transcriptional regulator n=1 Tax=Chelatococcus sp. GCM10030263 TaxID=3273387 RepID=UPI003610414E